MILWERSGPDECGRATVLSDNRTICGKYTGKPKGCHVEVLTDENCPDVECEVCEVSAGFRGSN